MVIPLLLAAILQVESATPDALESRWLRAVRASGVKSVEAGSLACQDPALEAQWSKVDERRIAIIRPHLPWFKQRPEKLLQAIPPVLMVKEPKCPDQTAFASELKLFAETVTSLEAATAAFWSKKE